MGRKNADAYQDQKRYKKIHDATFIVGRKHMYRFVSGFFRQSEKMTSLQKLSRSTRPRDSHLSVFLRDWTLGPVGFHRVQVGSH
jgi:hypothetical protein